MKGKKDKYGFTFHEAIFSGAKNTDSGIGCYAGSHDSYKTFAPFFDKIIEDYHQHGKDAKHVSNMNAKELNAPPLPEDEAAMIVSTRIRVGRNLKILSSRCCLARGGIILRFGASEFLK